GTAPTYIALSLGGEPLFVSAVGLAAFLGHLFPVFLSFRGGKGVATACGVMAVISPLAVVLSAVVFAVVVKIKRYVSLGSMLSAASLPVFLTLLAPARYYVWLGVIIALFIIVKHRENIKRLAAGVENKT
ncbi:MAG TPA: glycerol-3-phosphate acyltransferase, partial [Thermodesulfobacteriota bacterium]|nr:glycerol-3-phosphate acyltransferase [Thermodesulfobacteriota bacterium]